MNSSNTPTTWDDVRREWEKSPAYQRYAWRYDRFTEDYERSYEAVWTRRAVVVATRKYRARRKRK